MDSARPENHWQSRRQSRVCCQTGGMAAFRSITAYAAPGTSAFGLGVVGEIFVDRTHRGLPAFELTVCSDQPGHVRTDLGLTLKVEHGLDRLAGADLVLLLPRDTYPYEPSPVAVAAVRAAYECGAIIVSHCVGSYLLAATGLLDGARATTHWRLAADFAARFPAVTVVSEVLYVDEGRIVTGAGGAAGIDLYLYLLRREHGAAVATAIAREIVVAPHRDGGQAQYIAVPVPAGGDDERLAEVTAWARAHLHEPLSIGDLAARALMSQRTFARRFRAVIGATPHAWVLTQRLDRAEELLETTDLPVEEVARRVGYRTATVLREQFVKRRGVPPRAYRRTFTRR